MPQSESNFLPDLDQILAGDALGDLDTIERQRLAQPLSDDDKRSAEELQLTAAALQLALASQESEPMPSALRARIASDAVKHFPLIDPGPQVHRSVSGVHPNNSSWRERLAWFVTAASLIFAVGVFASSRRSSTNVASNLVQSRSELISQSEDELLVAWDAGTSPFEKAVTGDVVWSTSRQQGFLRFVGMPINNPTIEQYQLWIIDPQRDDEPIDGGVFNVTSNGEVIIPIDAKLPVIGPAAFAVTIEKPGGVVVSDQKRLPLLAKVPVTKS